MSRPAILSSALALSIGLAGGGIGSAVLASSAMAGVVAPTVAATAAASTGIGAATFSGVFVPGDEEASYSFEYGTSEGYGIGTPSVAVPAGAAPVIAQASVADLGVGQTWHYRLVVRSASGIAYGPDQLFTTPVAASAPLVLPDLAAGVGSDRATLVARVDPAGQDTSVVFQYGTSPSLGSQTAAVAVAAGATLAAIEVPVGGLTPATTYFARAVATNASGTTVGATLPLVTSAAVTKIDAAGEQRTLSFGRSTELFGRLTGTGIGGATVELVKQDFPFTGPRTSVAVTAAGDDGGYGFPVSPTATTKYWVQSRTTPVVSSERVTVYGKLAVKIDDTKSSRTGVTLDGTIEPYVSTARATIQRRSGSGRWITVTRPKLSRDGKADRSEFTATVRRYSKTMKYRVLVDPRNAGAQYATASNVLGVTRKK